MVGQLVRAGGHRRGDQHLLQVVEEGRVLLREERDGLPALPGTACTTDPVGVHLD